MAARLRARHQEDVRKKIQASHLIKLLQDDATGKLKPELTPGRRDSAKFLLNKSVSNAPTEVLADIDANVTVEIVRFADTNSK